MLDWIKYFAKIIARRLSPNKFSLKEIKNKITKEVEAGKIKTTQLVNMIFNFCEIYSGRVMFPYQAQFSKRVIRSVLENDGAEITALFARQCLPKDSLVYLRDGSIVPIQDAPNSFLTRKNASVMKINIRGGYTIKCTDNHPIMTNRGWVNAGDLTYNDKVVVLDEWNKFCDGEIVVGGKLFQMNDELAELIGWLIADGTIERNRSISFSNKNEMYLSRVTHLVNKYFPEVNVKRYGKSKVVDLTLTTNNRENPLRDFMFGLEYVDKFPVEVTKFTRSQTIAFLSAVFASDGYFYFNKAGNAEIGIGARGRMYAEYLREMLNKLGIIGRIKCENRRIIRKGKSYRIFICGNRNGRKLAETLNLYDKELPDFGKFNIREVETFDGEDGEKLKYASILSIKPDVEKVDVYDMTVPEKHWFIYNGVKVHNSGKTETIAITVGGMMIILPQLANMPMFLNDQRLQMFIDGFWVGIFAPSLRQSQITYGRMKGRLQCKEAIAILEDDDFRLNFTTSNGQTVSLSNGSFCTAISASDGSSIEGESFKFIILEECQDISNYKIRKSIHPMGAAYNATICKIGTATTFKGDFFDVIKRNKDDFKRGKTPIRNHFEYDGDTVAKYNPKYAKYLEREKRSLGENSDEYQMSYKLKWCISRGMFIDIAEYEKTCGDDYLDRVYCDLSSTHCVGIDVGGGNNSNNRSDLDSTVITVVEVDWDSPVVMESSVDIETGEDLVYLAYNTYIKDWYEIDSSVASNYEEQYNEIMNYLDNFKVARLVIDATREASLGQRIQANVKFEVELFTFSSKSKSDLYKFLQTEINTGRARFPKSEKTMETKEYKKFIRQMADLQKSYSGSYLVVSHPSERGAHDDFTDSYALAIWGTRGRAEVDNTETKDRRDTMQNLKGTAIIFKGRNRFTGKRR